MGNNNFDELGINDKLLRGVYSYGFEKPSSIQKKAVMPFIYGLNGKRKDIIAQAQSGTGKTGAFVVGALQIMNEKLKKTQVLILAPTHELARQIKNVVDALGNYLKVESILLVGGTSVDENRKQIDKAVPQVVVGTPGRVHDMIRRKFLDVSNLDLLVLDEADEMLSTGFKEQMGNILQYMPEHLQIGLFSATLNDDLMEVAKTFMRTPISRKSTH